jgi:hypothetical protein
MPGERRGAGRWRRNDHYQRTQPGGHCPRGLYAAERPVRRWRRTRNGRGSNCGCGQRGCRRPSTRGSKVANVPSLPNMGVQLARRLCTGSPVLLQVKPSTGEPDAGDPHVRFGGRGDRIQSVLPTPIWCFNGLWIPALRFATAGMTNWDGADLFPHPARNGLRGSRHCRSCGPEIIAEARF